MKPVSRGGEQNVMIETVSREFLFLAQLGQGQLLLQRGLSSFDLELAPNEMREAQEIANSSDQFLIDHGFG